MYEKFYGFREKPFALTPDPQFLFLSNHHRSALTQLEYCLINDSPFCLISGEVGSGKTTLIRYLLNRVDKTVTVGLLNNTRRGAGRLMQWVALAYGLDHRKKDTVTLYKEFEAFLIQEYAMGHRVVLIVDEAQNLGRSKLEELRLLSNINADKNLLLQIILVGQPELREQIKSKHLVQLAQRVAIDYHIGPLSAEETRNYIWHRLRIAGGPVSLFSSDAIRLVYLHSRGIPRLVNRICDTALVYGYGEQASRITGSIIRDVIAENDATGVLAGHQDEAVRERVERVD